MKKLKEIYQKLMILHGPQGWWPVKGSYHKRNFNYPRNNDECFEICVGAILTQNTAWTNVEMAIENLRRAKLLNANKIMQSKDELIQTAIRPSGYFNQKTKKLKVFSIFYKTLKGRKPTRNELLDLWGIGPETADSILLYAYGEPTFVIDAYTKRIFSHLKIIDESWTYDEIKELFESYVPQDKNVYQEYHALIVEHAKKYYSKKPYGTDCPLIKKK